MLARKMGGGSDRTRLDHGVNAQSEDDGTVV